MNAALKEILMLEAPAIAKDYIEYTEPLVKRTLEKFPTLRGSAWDGYYFDRVIAMQHCEVMEKSIYAGQSTFQYSKERTELAAKRYAEDQCLAWFEKLNRKLVNVTDMTMTRLSRNEYYFVAKLGDKKIAINQQRILKCSPKGKMFHQFPARIYVDGKFYSEANFKKEFQC